MKILLVDDDEACLNILGLLLTSNGHDIEAVNDPKYALVRFREAAQTQLPFDVVITDFNMPGWSGLTLSMYIANCCATYQIKAPVICITGNTSDANRLNDNSRNPISKVLEKGCTMAEIQNALNLVTKL